MKGEGACRRGALLTSISWAVWGSLRFFPSSSSFFPYNFYYKYCFCSLQVPIWFLPCCSKLRTVSVSFMFGVIPLDQSVLLRRSRISLLSQSAFLQFPQDHLKCSESTVNARLERNRAEYVLLMTAQAIKLYWFLMGGLKGKKGLLQPLGSHIGSSKLRPGVCTTN